MIEFIVQNDILKKALILTSTATGDSKMSIEGQCLFNLEDNSLKILSTNRSTCFARALLDVTGSGNGRFTVDPTKILNLIKMSGADAIKFIYHPESTTVEIYASEEEDSFISLTSLDSTQFPDIEENFDKAFEVKTMDAGIFIKGVKFAEGFLLTGKNSGKFGNMFISKGVLYGTNGNNQAGAYTSTEFEGLDDLTFPGPVLTQISNIINKLNLSEISLRTTSTSISIFSADGKLAFGFTKVQLPMPRIPVSVEEPESNSWEVDIKLLLKKIGRLQISGESGMGIEMCLSSNRLDLVTKVERPSKESLPCTGKEEAMLTADCWMLEKILDLFEGTTLMIYAGKTRMTLYSKGSIQIQEKDTERSVPFSCAALVALAAV